MTQDDLTTAGIENHLLVILSNMLFGYQVTEDQVIGRVQTLMSDQRARHLSGQDRMARNNYDHLVTQVEEVLENLLQLEYNPWKESCGND